MKHNNESSKNEKPKKRGKLPIPPPDPSLKWVPDKHDLKIESFRSEEARKKAMAIVGSLYQTWKRKLEKDIKKGRVKSTQHLVAAIYDLHGQVANAVKHSPGMEEWRAFTMNLLEDKVSQLIRTAGGKNEIMEYIPDALVQDSHRLIIPQTHQFATLEEFNALPYIQRFAAKVDFIGFVLSGKFVKAIFLDGTIEPVGIVMSYTGIGKLPTEQQMRDELGKLPEDE